VTQTSSDIVIVGGGPAGLYAGLRLSRLGWSVALFEEHRDIGEPVHCTGVLAREAFEVFGLPADAVLNELKTVRFYAPSGETGEHATPPGEAVVIDRSVFDRQLAAEAERAGVRMHRARVTALEVERDGVRVTAGDAVARARACVLACGANYVLQRRLGLGLPRMLLQSAQAEIPADRLGAVEVHFGADVAPGGFAWAVPVQRLDRTCVRVGVMCDSDAGRHFRRMFDAVAPRWGARLTDSCVPRQKVLPLAPIKRTYADRVLVLGDAAGLVKPTTGGGIYYSLLSGDLAAETLAEALSRDTLDENALAAYESAWRKRLGPELRWQLILRRIAQRLSDSDIDQLFDLARTDGIMPLVRRTATFNRHREFIMALLKHQPARRVLFRAALA
jgi:digeranylgeranylglycerophospholipid reductase